jgi:hypothetical protein
MTTTTDQIHVLFSEEGEACAIRKWSKEPFYGGQTYVQKALLDTLAARVLELEAENKRLRKEILIVIDDCEADYPPTYGAIKYGLRAALKGGEI